MTGPTKPDCFAHLHWPRQAWIDPEALQARFLELSSRCHPDTLGAARESERQAASAQFAELNAAYQTLRDSRMRLAHLLELESGTTPPNLEQVSADSADLFFQVGALCRQADGFLAERARATSPLIKATLFAKGLEWTTRLQDLQAVLSRQVAELDSELQAMNPLWSAEAAPESRPRARLEEIYRRLSFLDRWTSQLRERLVQLAV